MRARCSYLTKACHKARFALPRRKLSHKAPPTSQGAGSPGVIPRRHVTFGVVKRGQFWESRSGRDVRNSGCFTLWAQVRLNKLFVIQPCNVLSLKLVKVLFTISRALHSLLCVPGNKFRHGDDSRPRTNQPATARFAGRLPAHDQQTHQDGLAGRQYCALRYRYGIFLLRGTPAPHTKTFLWGLFRGGRRLDRPIRTRCEL